MPPIPAGLCNITLASFGTTFPCGDGSDLIRMTRTLRLRRVAREPEPMKIALSTPQNMTWWKGIRILDADGNIPDRAKPEAFTEGDSHVDILWEGPIEDLGGSATIIFSKAKLFGIHTDMYALRLNAATLNTFREQFVMFRWVSD
jgi:hypothetical protein